MEGLDYRKFTPVRQGITILVLIIVADLITWVGSGDAGVFSGKAYWINCITFMLVYALFNSLLSLLFKDQNAYWGRSIAVYAGIAILGGLLAYAFSGMTIDEAGSFRWLYLVFTLGYLIFLAIVRTIRKIVAISQRQDKRLRGEE